MVSSMLQRDSTECIGTGGVSEKVGEVRPSVRPPHQGALHAFPWWWESNWQGATPEDEVILTATHTMMT